MRCRFSSNGIAIDYTGTVKPCCVFVPDAGWKSRNHITQVDLGTWHRQQDVIRIRRGLESDQWPQACQVCQSFESQDRGDSVRLNGEQSYAHYQDQDITLEIRGGNTCNFACQTCWPSASTRVSQFYKQAQIPIQTVNDTDWDFDTLLPIRHRIKNIQLLGGEPFYDRRCLRFLQWVKDHDISAEICIFTNGSVISKDLLRDMPGKVILVWSIDAVGRPAEYIRYGTQWSVVEENFRACQDRPNVENRVNITTSPYNLYYLPELLSWLGPRWPSVVSFGIASTTRNTEFMTDSVFPWQVRQRLISKLDQGLAAIEAADIEHFQRINAINAVSSIKDNLVSLAWNHDNHQRLIDFIHRMDRVKHIDIWDYCPEVAECLETNDHTLDRLSSVFLTGER